MRALFLAGLFASALGLFFQLDPEVRKREGALYARWLRDPVQSVVQGVLGKRGAGCEVHAVCSEVCRCSESSDNAGLPVSTETEINGTDTRVETPTQSASTLGSGMPTDVEWQDFEPGWYCVGEWHDYSPPPEYLTCSALRLVSRSCIYIGSLEDWNNMHFGECMDAAGYGRFMRTDGIKHDTEVECHVGGSSPGQIVAR